MPTRAWYARRYKGDGFRGGFTLLAAIGQGATAVTVMQLALSYAALANDGTLYQPQVVRSIETSSGTTVQDFPPRVRKIIDVDPVQLGVIKQALRGVVAEPKGTAFAEAIAGVDVAGKTGTAQSDPKRKPFAWFTSFAPVDDPEVAVAVIVEDADIPRQDIAGGRVAAPIARATMQAALE